MATPTITNEYVERYSYSVEDANAVLTLLRSFDEDETNFLEIGDKAIYERFHYLNEFQATNILDPSTRLTINVFNQRRPESVPETNCVLLSDNYLKFVLASITGNLCLLEEFGHSNQQRLFLYFVE